MTYDEACSAAKRHLTDNPLPHADYRWLLSDGRETPDGWYFDYRVEPVRPIPEAQREQLGGAPGFIVERDTGEVRVVGWREYSSLRRAWAE